MKAKIEINGLGIYFSVPREELFLEYIKLRIIEEYREAKERGETIFEIKVNVDIDINK